MSRHVHGVEAGVKHRVRHEHVATATVLQELALIQMHRLVYKEGSGEVDRGIRRGRQRDQER